MSRFLSFSHVFFVGEFCILKVVLYVGYLQKMKMFSNFWGRFIFRSSYAWNNMVFELGFFIKWLLFDLGLLIMWLLFLLGFCHNFS